VTYVRGITVCRDLTWWDLPSVCSATNWEEMDLSWLTELGGISDKSKEGDVNENIDALHSMPCTPCTRCRAFLMVPLPCSALSPFVLPRFVLRRPTRPRFIAKPVWPSMKLSPLRLSKYLLEFSADITSALGLDDDWPSSQVSSRYHYNPCLSDRVSRPAPPLRVILHYPVLPVEANIEQTAIPETSFSQLPYPAHKPNSSRRVHLRFVSPRLGKLGMTISPTDMYFTQLGCISLSTFVNRSAAVIPGWDARFRSR